MRIGIDLGTTNCAVAYMNENNIAEIIPNKEGNRTTPSVILYEDGTFIVGEVAKDDSVDNSDNIVQFVKRQIGNPVYKNSFGGKEYTPEELSAIILKRLKEDAENYLGKPVTEAVITVPAYFDDAQRKATIDAGAIAGLNVLKIINEPTAAALAYASNDSKPQKILVYDLGGGTFDVTLMSYSNEEIRVIATEGNRALGGFDFDNAIITYISDKFEQLYNIDLEDDDEAYQDLRLKAEQAKKTLTSRGKTTITISSEGNKLKEEITQELFKDMTSNLIERTYLIIDDVLKEAGVQSSEVDKILLIGGSTRMPAVEEMIIEKFGIEPSKDINPDEAVAIGAAIQGSLIDDMASVADTSYNKTVIDVNSHGLGIVANNDEGISSNTILIPRNTEIPTKVKETFYTVEENQDSVNLRITEGDSMDLEEVKIIGESIMTLNPRPANSPIDIVISYDKDAIIQVEAFDGVDQSKLKNVVIERKSNLTQADVDTMKNELSSISVE